MIQCHFTEAPISIDSILREFKNPGHGARVLFLGTIRDLNFDRIVEAVSYDAFIPLAKKILFQICEEARIQWGESLSATIVHRLGRVAVGETSVAIAVSLPHRHEAYQASRYLIDALKHRAPIWKKEHYGNGESEWLQGCGLEGVL